MPLGKFAALLVAIDAEIRPVERSIPAWMEGLFSDHDDDSVRLDDDQHGLPDPRGAA